MPWATSPTGCNLTPVAIREAHGFAETEFYGKPTTFDHADVPTAVFSQPPIGAVGLTEKPRRGQGQASTSTNPCSGR